MFEVLNNRINEYPPKYVKRARLRSSCFADRCMNLVTRRDSLFKVESLSFSSFSASMTNRTMTRRKSVDTSEEAVGILRLQLYKP